MCNNFAAIKHCIWDKMNAKNEAAKAAEDAVAGVEKDENQIKEEENDDKFFEAEIKALPADLRRYSQGNDVADLKLLSLLKPAHF